MVMPKNPRPPKLRLPRAPQPRTEPIATKQRVKLPTPRPPSRGPKLKHVVPRTAPLPPRPVPAQRKPKTQPKFRAPSAPHTTRGRKQGFQWRHAPRVPHSKSSTRASRQHAPHKAKSYEAPSAPGLTLEAAARAGAVYVERFHPQHAAHMRNHPPKPTPKPSPPRPAVPTRPPVVITPTFITVAVGPKVVIVNQSAHVEAAAVAAAAAALSRQVNEHFALPPPIGFGIGCRLRVASVGAPPQPDEWVLLLTDKIDVSGALGYHDVTPHGLPVMRVFPKLDIDEGLPWTPTASHELLETLADPNIAKCAQAPDGRMWAYEVADAVEADSYLIDGVPVSNFVTPLYFEPPAHLTDAQFDYLKLVKQPYEIRPGGYNQFWTGTSWQEVFAEHALPRRFRQARRLLASMTEKPTSLAQLGRGIRRQLRVTPEVGTLLAKLAESSVAKTSDALDHAVREVETAIDDNTAPTITIEPPKDTTTKRKKRR